MGERRNEKTSATTSWSRLLPEFIPILNTAEGGGSASYKKSATAADLARRFDVVDERSGLATFSHEGVVQAPQFILPYCTFKPRAVFSIQSARWSHVPNFLRRSPARSMRGVKTRCSIEAGDACLADQTRRTSWNSPGESHPRLHVNFLYLSLLVVMRCRLARYICASA